MWFIDWIKTQNEKRLAIRALRTMKLAEILAPSDDRPEWWEKIMMEEIVLNRRAPINELGRLVFSEHPCATNALVVLVAILTDNYPHAEHPRDRRGWPTSWAAFRSERLVDLVISLGYESDGANIVLTAADERLPYYQLERFYADLSEQLVLKLPMRLQELHFACFVYDPRDDDSNPWE